MLVSNGVQIYPSRDTGFIGLNPPAALMVPASDPWDGSFVSKYQVYPSVSMDQMFPQVSMGIQKQRYPSRYPSR